MMGEENPQDVSYSFLSYLPTSYSTVMNRASMMTENAFCVCVCVFENHNFLKTEHLEANQ